MANTYTSLYYHIVFSAKNRVGCIKSDIEQRAWQDGYGAFTVNKSIVPDVERYIRNQREHHRKVSFQEEYLEFLKKHGVDYDEHYLWG